MNDGGGNIIGNDVPTFLIEEPPKPVWPQGARDVEAENHISDFFNRWSSSEEMILILKNRRPGKAIQDSEIWCNGCVFSKKVLVIRDNMIGNVGIKSEK